MILVVVVVVVVRNNGIGDLLMAMVVELMFLPQNRLRLGYVHPFSKKAFSRQAKTMTASDLRRVGGLIDQRFTYQMCLPHIFLGIAVNFSHKPVTLLVPLSLKLII